MSNEPEHLTGLDRLAADIKRLAGLAAKWGAVLAIICHLLPPHYRLPCEAVAKVCHAVGGH